MAARARRAFFARGLIEGEMKGSEIRGPVAKEAAEKWPRIASAASIIV